MMPRLSRPEWYGGEKRSNEIIKTWMDDVLQGLLFKTWINVEVQYWKIVQYKFKYIYIL